jgi:hypothetical protein
MPITDLPQIIHFVTPVLGLRTLNVETIESDASGVTVVGVTAFDPTTGYRLIVPWHNVLGVSQQEDRGPVQLDEVKGSDGLTDDERRIAKAKEEKGEQSSPGTSTSTSSRISEPTNEPSETPDRSPARTTEPRSTPDQTAGRTAVRTGGGRLAGK